MNFINLVGAIVLVLVIVCNQRNDVFGVKLRLGIISFCLSLSLYSYFVQLK